MNNNIFYIIKLIISFESTQFYSMQKKSRTLAALFIERLFLSDEITSEGSSSSFV